MQTIQIEKDDPQEHPISIGENTLSFIKNQTKLDDDGKTIVIDEAMNILKHCIVPGINSEITNIAIGYVQSGKTMSFTTLTALAADNGYRVIIYLTGTKANLLQQTTNRLRQDLNVDGGDTYRLYTDIEESVSISNNAKNFLNMTDEVLLFPILKKLQPNR